MPNFKYDPKSGSMKPVERKEIYFSRSMSGGLRVDDHINNVKYIIERTGEIKIISGMMKGVNIYDNRNAHIIADRVKRMFGMEHEYTNYRKFLKGVNIVESFDDFVNEGFVNKTLKRTRKGEARIEDGMKVKTPTCTVLLDDKGCGQPYPIGKDGVSYFRVVDFDGVDVTLFGYEDEGSWTYFAYDESGDYEDEGNLRQVATSDYDMVTDDFVLLEAFAESGFDPDMTDMVFTSQTNRYMLVIGDRDFPIYDDYDNAKDDALEDCKHLIEDCGIDDQSMKRWRDYFGNDFIDADSIEEFMKEDFESYVNDIENEDGDMGNRLFDELCERELIENTDEYFETDEDGELDYESPKFDIDEMKESLVDEMCSDHDDPVEWYIFNFGSDGLVEYIDTDKLAELIVDSDGIANTLARYAGEEYEYHKNDYDIYIYN